jgi:hypothetical protein
MSLSSRALDRLLARCVDRLTLGLAPSTIIPGVSIEDRLDREVAEQVKSTLARQLDNGGVEHRIQDVLDCKVGEALDKVDVDSRVDDIIERAVDTREIDRRIEHLDLEEMAAESLEKAVDWEALCKDAIRDATPDEDEMLDRVNEEITSRLDDELMGCPRKDPFPAEDWTKEANGALRRILHDQIADRVLELSGEVVSHAVDAVVGQVNTKLESEVRS